jgi:hypothetical protein
MRTTAARLALVVLAVAAFGCAPIPARVDAPSPAAGSDVNAAFAVARARKDAAESYGAAWGGPVNARYANGFWVVTLHAADGGTLRYAISSRDGSIRERNVER